MVRRIEIVHVYGHCGELRSGVDVVPYGGNDAHVDQAGKASNSINVVAPRTLPPAAERIRQIVAESERLCFLGFSFLKDNLDKLQAGDLGNRTIYGTRLRMSDADVDGAYKYFKSPRQGYLFDCAVRNKLHVVATTQNPATLNALTDEQFDSVLLVAHQAGEKSARLLPLSELPGYIEFMEQGRLGDLVTRRIYERHLQPDYEKERVEGITKWVESLP